ncbi:hypothetical protein ACLOJK_005067 [Asimina triloba]
MGGGQATSDITDRADRRAARFGRSKAGQRLPHERTSRQLAGRQSKRARRTATHPSSQTTCGELQPGMAADTGKHGGRKADPGERAAANGRMSQR